MPDLRSLAAEILADAHLLHLGVSDSDGAWVASVVFASDDDFNIFWLSVPSTRHSRAIENSKRAAASIVASEAGERERALQLEGGVEQVERPSDSIVARLASKRGTSQDELEKKITQRGLLWYRLTPERLELIYNELFGYDRKRVL